MTGCHVHGTGPKQWNVTVNKTFALPRGSLSVMGETAAYIHDVTGLSRVKCTMQCKRQLTIKFCGKTGRSDNRHILVSQVLSS